MAFPPPVHDLETNACLSRFAYCQYDSTATATHAKEALDGTIFDNREIAVNFAGYNIEGRTFASPPSRTLYVANLPFDLSHQELHGLFKDIPNVYDIRVSVDRNTGLLRGFVHAEFLDVESARMGFELLSAKSVYGRTLRLDYSKSIRQLRPNWRNRPAS
jgi:nucleolin